MKAELFSIPVNLIRQWCYCPRIVYYIEMFDNAVSRPRWVEQGEKFHTDEEKLWSRRNLSRFGLQKGIRRHNLFMKNSDIGIHGIADMIIETNEAVYAVEFKLSAQKKRRGDVLQLCAYSMLAENHFKKPAHTGFLIGKGRVLYTIAIDRNQREAVSHAATSIRKILTQGRKPDSSATILQCCNCEYINHCNDR